MRQLHASQLLIVSLPKAMPRSQPRPVPLSASDTSPLVITCACADFTAPACASPAAYEPSSSLMLLTAENLPLPSSIVDLPTVSPPPLALSLTFIDWPLLHLMTPVPLAVL